MVSLHTRELPSKVQKQLLFLHPHFLKHYTNGATSFTTACETSVGSNFSSGPVPLLPDSSTPFWGQNSFAFQAHPIKIFYEDLKNPKRTERKSPNTFHRLSLGRNRETNSTTIILIRHVPIVSSNRTNVLVHFPFSAAELTRGRASVGAR